MTLFTLQTIIKISYKTKFHNEKGGTKMEWFKSKKLTEHITRITDVTGVYMYLVQGCEEALLIDTGSGIGNLKEYIEGITCLPLTVVCTHGHLDHAGGALQFDRVYMDSEDIELSLSHCTIENRKKYADISASMMNQDANYEVETWDYWPVRTIEYEELTDGMEFSLGGICVKAISLKGHTKGCKCMLFCEERSILFGDACNPSVFLFDEETTSVEEYREELLRFQKYEELYDRVWLSHGDGQPLEKSILENCIEVCEEILAGKDEKAEFQFFMGGTYRTAHTMLPSQQRKDGGRVNVIYNPQHIRRKQ